MTRDNAMIIWTMGRRLFPMSEIYLFEVIFGQRDEVMSSVGYLR